MALPKSRMLTSRGSSPSRRLSKHFISSNSKTTTWQWGRGGPKIFTHVHVLNAGAGPTKRHLGMGAGGTPLSYLTAPHSPHSSISQVTIWLPPAAPTPQNAYGTGHLELELGSLWYYFISTWTVWLFHESSQTSRNQIPQREALFLSCFILQIPTAHYPIIKTIHLLN